MSNCKAILLRLKYTWIPLVAAVTSNGRFALVSFNMWIKKHSPWNHVIPTQFSARHCVEHWNVSRAELDGSKLTFSDNGNSSDQDIVICWYCFTTQPLSPQQTKNRIKNSSKLITRLWPTQPEFHHCHNWFLMYNKLICNQKKLSYWITVRLKLKPNIHT